MYPATMCTALEMVWLGSTFEGPVGVVGLCRARGHGLRRSGSTEGYLTSLIMRAEMRVPLSTK
jgi:hypothetical protein